MGRPKKIVTIDPDAYQKAHDSVYSDKPLPVIPPVPVQPPPTSPAVLALQSSIVEMISQRAEYRKIIAAAQAELFSAQARVQAANGDLLALESEVNYRMGVIAQMENRAPQVPATSWPGTYDLSQPQSIGMTLSGISSEPAMPSRPQFSDPNDMVNHGSATRSML